MPESAIKFGAYEVGLSLETLLFFFATHNVQAAKRTFARLEGHNNPKRLLPVSQFLSGGFGGMVAQYVENRLLFALTLPLNGLHWLYTHGSCCRCFVYPLDTLKL